MTFHEIWRGKKGERLKISQTIIYINYKLYISGNFYVCCYLSVFQGFPHVAHGNCTVKDIAM